MFPVDPSFLYIAYLECAAIGLVLGLVTGVLASIVLKARIRGSSIALDGILAASMSVIVTGVLWHLARGFRYNFIAAVGVAIAVPAVREFYCFKRVDTTM